MRKTVALASLLLLSACMGSNQGTAPGVKPVQVPALPAELSKKAEKLPPITDNTMGGQVTEGVNSDRAYNAVAHQVNALIDVYVCVRETINNNRDPQTCFK